MKFAWIFLTFSFVTAFLPPTTQMNRKKIMLKNQAHLKNATDPENTTVSDPITSIGTFMGYPPEQKWKGVRVMLYSFVGGSLIREMLDNYLDSKDEIVDFFSRNL